MEELEQLKLVLVAWGIIGIIACILALFAWNKMKKKNPDFATLKASPQEQRKAKIFVMGVLCGVLLYVVLLMAVVAAMSYEFTPWIIYGVCALFAVAAIAFFVGSLRQK